MQTLGFPNKIYQVYFPWATDPSIVLNLSLLWKSDVDFLFFVLENWEKGHWKSWSFFGLMVYEPCFIILLFFFHKKPNLFHVLLSLSNWSDEKLPLWLWICAQSTKFLLFSYFFPAWCHQAFFHDHGDASQLQKRRASGNKTGTV